MIRSLADRLYRLGGFSFLLGILLVACTMVLGSLPNLRGPNIPVTLTILILASAAYGAAVLRLDREQAPLAVIWAIAILARLPLLLQSPTLSDDVYRYIWDSRLISAGISPYAFPVNSPALDSYATPLRALVNHSWMASPYLPAAQLYFLGTAWLAPPSPLAFQATALGFDLACAGLVMGLLARTGLAKRLVLVYLWNPLVIVEAAHGAHIEYWMIFLTLLAFWALGDPARAGLPSHRTRSEPASWVFSALALAAAALTKAIPALLAPLFFRRWRFPGILLFIGTLFGLSAVFAAWSGWGLSGPSDGRGLFGAIRIYLSDWNYNSSLYHWLETGLSGVQTPGPVPLDPEHLPAVRFARLLSSSLLALVVSVTGVLAWVLDSPRDNSLSIRLVNLLRLALLPLGGYLMLTTTVHPWYLVVIVPFLPFTWPLAQEPDRLNRLAWPWIYLSCAVMLSYGSYLDPARPQEFTWVRLVEYLPFYALLIWSAALVLAKRRSTHQVV